MTLHRSCCPCDGCYCGTLCTPCLEPCEVVEQPSATACISKREWDNNIDSVTAGSGSGWVIWVNGAYYFFDGTLSSCDTPRASSVDWLISFRADECPDFSLGLDIVVPFIGGWDFSRPYTVTADVESVENPDGCAFQTPGTGVTPVFTGWSHTLQSPGLTAYDEFYGPSEITAYGGGMVPCVSPNEEIGTFGLGSCGSNPAEAVSTTSISGGMSAAVAVGVLPSDEAFRISFVCDAGSASVEVIDSLDADGYFVFEINGTCQIRFIGPVAQFVNVVRAFTAGSSLTASVLDGNWFLGSKVRPAYVGTVDQPTFPGTGVTPTGLQTLNTVTTSVDFTVQDIAYDALSASASFNGSYNNGTDICAVQCVVSSPAPASAMFTTLLSVAAHSSSIGSGRVREMYGIDLHPTTWSWSLDLTGWAGTDCGPVGGVLEVS